MLAIRLNRYEVGQKFFSLAQIESSKENIQMFSLKVPELLNKAIVKNQPSSIIDIGCGDGTLLFALEKKNPKINLIGYDLSKERLNRIEKKSPSIKTFQGDACKLDKLEKLNCSFIISTQVIEHVSSDDKMISEIYNNLEPKGIIYISSVVKKWYGWWIYKCNGKTTCDPTHLREYSSKEAFEIMLKKGNFEIIESKMTPFMPSILNNTFRVLLKFNLISNEKIQNIYKSHPKMVKFFNSFLRIPAPGYYNIETLAYKK